MSIHRSFSRSSVCALVVVCAASGLAAHHPAVAAENGLMVRLGYAQGGDEIFSARLTNGDVDSIDAGDGLFVEIGARSQLLSPEWDTDLSVGYLREREEASNGEFSFTRLTLNLMQSYRLSESWRIGGGVTYHINTELEVDIPGIDDSVEGKDALGFILGADFKLEGKPIELGIRATQIEYESDDRAADVVDGDSVAGHVTFHF